MKLNKIEITIGSAMAFIVILVTLIVINTKQNNIKYSNISSIKEEAYKMSNSVALAKNPQSKTSNVNVAMQQEQVLGNVKEGDASLVASKEQAKVKNDEAEKQQEIAAEEKKKQQQAKKEGQTTSNYKGLSASEIGRKIDTLLSKSTLKGKGVVFAQKALALNMDPYLTASVMLHETGCAWKCSNLVRTKYNLGGLKGSNGSYKKFSSLDAGIEGYVNILYKNYYSKGLKTPEAMAKKYTGQKNPSTWISKVKSYMKKIEKA